jgi:hypothetical protein
MAITLEISSGATQLTLNTAAVPTSTATAANVSFSSYGNITATTVEGAIQQLADNSFSQSTEPDTNLNEGDIWYDTSTEQLYVYRETSTEVFEWVPILVGDAGGDSDTLDAGAF